MIKRSILILSLFLTVTACGEKEGLDIGIAKPVQIPNAPASLLVKAERLPDITDPTFGGIMLEGADTDTKYNDVSTRFNQLIDFTVCVQESVNEKKDIEKCLK